MTEERKKRVLYCFIAILISLLAFALAQNAQDTADINNVFEVVVNNTDLAPGMGTGERVSETVYYANNSPIELMVLAHANVVGDTATVEVFINGTMVQNQSGRPLAGAEQTYRSVAVVVPKFSNYTAHFHNAHHYEWREYPILSGKNGTLSINQTVAGTSFNATYAANISALQANDTYFNGSIFPNSTNFRNNTMYDLFQSGKVNKSGDNMTGRLSIGNASKATVELFVIENEGDPAAFRIETNSSQGGAFFGARYNGIRTDNQTPVLKNEILFHLSGIGTQTNNTYSTVAAEIRVVSDENFSSTKHPGSIEFWTAPNVTSANNAKRWKIESNGSLWPAANNQYAIGNATSKVKNLSIGLTPIGITRDAVCYDGTEISTNTGLATCTVSKLSAKNNITNASYNPLSLQRFQLITYDYVVKYPHVIEAEDRVEYTEKTVKRYGLTAEQVEAIDPLLVGHDEFGNPTGIHYEDLAAYLLNVTQAQQTKLDKICSRQPALCD